MPRKKSEPETKPKIATAQCVSNEDCVAGMARLDAGSAALVIADPPYNQGMSYDAYDDNKSYDEYLAWTLKWMTAAHRVLNASGAMWVFVPDEWVSEVDLLARKGVDLMARKGLKFYKQNHVVWYYTFGQAQQQKFTRSHCHLLWLTKHKTRFTFNADAVRVPSARQAVYKDKRANAPGKLPDDTWMLYKEQMKDCFVPDEDTWLESRICGTFKERKKHSPNQIPVPLMERIVKTCTDPGDLVLDPFAGTGSSGVACARLGRSYVGYDLSKLCVASAKSRIAAALTAA